MILMKIKKTSVCHLGSSTSYGSADCVLEVQTPFHPSVFHCCQEGRYDLGYINNNIKSSYLLIANNTPHRIESVHEGLQPVRGSARSIDLDPDAEMA